MPWRALILLTLAVGLSGLATWYFGADVLIALGLILVQLKIVAKKLWLIEWPVLLIWLKTQGSAFFKVELLKKYLMGTLVPLMLGKRFFRQLKLWLSGYLDGVRARQAAMMAWFNGLSGVEKGVAWAIILFGTLALSVSGLGLWLILFSVKLPLWVVSAALSLGKMVWTSAQKMLFRALAFLQLGWLWLGIKRLLPKSWLDWKRRWDFRVARAVVRRRRLTVMQLHDRKDRLPFRMGVLLEYLFRIG
ncbi:hypothetical protein [Pacificoceanicola onchidii]|uniref:hypothetical protein n=1 Tax=Pacificoceanicola onchidii TaxID=2562685 RepID=UPI0010A698EF|nr:hypothetical protein [Pacificoceanicola onchidii]